MREAALFFSLPAIFAKTGNFSQPRSVKGLNRQPLRNREHASIHIPRFQRLFPWIATIMELWERRRFAPSTRGGPVRPEIS